MANKKSKIEELSVKVDETSRLGKEKYSSYDPVQMRITLAGMAKFRDSTVVDHDHQRGSLEADKPDADCGNAGWAQPDFDEVMDSIYINRNFENDRILVADLNQCAQKCESKNDKEYFYNIGRATRDQSGDPVIFVDENKNIRIEMMFDFDSIDGNNTTQWLAAFVENKKTWRGNYFDDFSKETQEKFLSTEFVITVLRNVTPKQKTKIFRDRNSGPLMSDQRRRSCRTSFHAAGLRDVQRSFKGHWSLIGYSKKNLADLAQEEDVATWFGILEKIISTGTIPRTTFKTDDLDAQYEEHDNNISPKKILEETKRILEIFFKGLTEWKTTSKKLSKGKTAIYQPAIWAIIGIEQISDFKITNPSAFLQKFINEYSETFARFSKVDETQIDDDYQKTWKPAKRFTNLARNSAKGNNLFEWLMTLIEFQRDALRSAVAETPDFGDLEPGYQESLQAEAYRSFLSEWGISLKRKPKHNFNWKDKVKHMRKEGFSVIVEDENGEQVEKKYTAFDFYLGDVSFVSDHIIPHALGGATSEDNQVFMDPALNASKGASLPGDRAAAQETA